MRKHDEEKKIFRERISRESVHHLRGLVGHRNPHLVSILKVHCVNLHSETFEIVSSKFTIVVFGPENKTVKIW